MASKYKLNEMNEGNNEEDDDNLTKVVKNLTVKDESTLSSTKLPVLSLENKIEMPRSKKSEMDQVTSTINHIEMVISKKHPTSVLQSMRSFDELHLKPEFLKRIYASDVSVPSKLIETVLADPPQNMIIETGISTGRITTELVLVMLNRVDTSKPYPQVICLEPNYELVMQTGEMIARMAQFCSEILLRIGIIGTDVPKREKFNEHIIIGTPEKILTWGLKYKHFDLKQISVFILNEALIILDKFQDMCYRLHKQLSPKCQMILISSKYEKPALQFAEYMISNPIKVKLPYEKLLLDNIKQYYVKCKLFDKYDVLLHIFKKHKIEGVIIFCCTGITVTWLAAKLASDGHRVLTLFEDLNIDQRLAMMKRFRSGLVNILITTDVLFRGNDFKKLNVVVNFDLPICQQTYLKHISMIENLSGEGMAISLVVTEHDMQICREFEMKFGKNIQPLAMD